MKPLQPVTSYPAVVGAVLTFLRKRTSLTQAELAAKVFCANATWSRIENGVAGLTLGQLARAADILRTSPGQVIQCTDRIQTALGYRGVQVYFETPNAHKLRAESLVQVDCNTLQALVLSCWHDQEGESPCKF